MRLNDIANACGSSPDTVRSWVKAGMPKAARGFDPQTCLAWLRETGRTKPATRLAAHLQGPPKAKQTARKAKPSGDTSGDSLAAAANRARVLEQSLFDEWQAAKDAGLHDTAREVEKRYLDAAEQRRKIEKDLPDGQTKAGEVVPRADVERLWTGIGSAVCDDMLAIPVALSPRLVGRTDVAEVAATLEDAIRDALRHLADRVEVMK